MAILHAKSPDGTQKDIDIDSIVTDVKTGSANGTLSVNGTDVAVKGLGSAAYTASTAYAAANHGNHVPTTQTANNAVFLRNDNSWQTVTPANIGAAASDHTHSKMTAATEDAAGTAGFVPAPAAGKQASFLRGDGAWATPYSAGTAALLNTGTDTANRVWSAKIISDFVESKCTPGSSIAANGYVKLDSGLIIQWGHDTEPSSNNPSKAITFPIKFTTVFIAVACNAYDGDGDPDYYGAGVTSLTVSGFTYKSGTYGGKAFYWIALGK